MDELHEFKNHSYRVVDDENMKELVDSIKEHGVLTPGTVRPLEDGGYEIIAGHRRKHASELAGKKTMPVYVQDISDDEATILMVDLNIQKLLYGLMLDRMSLSRKCGWFDEEGKVFIKYSRNKIAEDLNLGKDTAGNLLKDLVEFGLIDMVQESGKANIIFVKNFVEVAEEKIEGNEDQSENPTSSEPIDRLDNPTGTVSQLADKSNQSENARGRSILPVEKVDQSENPMGTGRVILPEPVGKFASINTKYNTKVNDTEILSINRQKGSDGWIDDVNKKAEYYMELIQSNIDYESMMSVLSFNDKEMYDELYDIICDIVCVPREIVRVDSRDYPYEMVKSRYLKLKSNHLEYVMDSLKNCTSEISNIRAYLITALYNAPATINNYYHSKVNHDLYGKQA